jgi:muramoyltetrapeptide carboxypeptidase
MGHSRADWTAGNPEQRARDLITMFADPEVNAIQCLRGGTNSAEVITHVDFNVIAAHPKPFIGSSDITALHTALLHKWARMPLLSSGGCMAALP